MKRKKLAWLVAICTAAMIIMLAISFYLSSARYRPTEPMITLPGENGDSITLPQGDIGANAAVLDGVSVDKTNVKNVIATLIRPQEYYMEAETSIIYHSDKKQQNLQLSVKNDMSKIEILSPANVLQKEIILSPNSYYSWNNGARGFYKGARGEYSYDDAGALPTYEDVLGLDDGAIISAGFQKYGTEPCIAVTVDNALSGAQDVYYISVSSGLLYAAQSHMNGMMTYEMKQTALNMKDIPAETFTLPTGQIAD